MATLRERPSTAANADISRESRPASMSGTLLLTLVPTAATIADVSIDMICSRLLQFGVEVSDGDVEFCLEGKTQSRSSESTSNVAKPRNPFGSTNDTGASRCADASTSSNYASGVH